MSPKLLLVRARPGRWLKMDEAQLKHIDQALELGRKHGVHINLNLHRAPGYCVKPTEGTARFVKGPRGARRLRASLGDVRAALQRRYESLTLEGAEGESYGSAYEKSLRTGRKDR